RGERTAEHGQGQRRGEAADGRQLRVLRPGCARALDGRGGYGHGASPILVAWRPPADAGNRTSTIDPRASLPDRIRSPLPLLDAQLCVTSVIPVSSPAPAGSCVD